MPARLKSGDLCPQCRESQLERIHRQEWMRRLPHSKLYQCFNCQARFLTVYFFAFRLGKAKE